MEKLCLPVSRAPVECVHAHGNSKFVSSNVRKHVSSFIASTGYRSTSTNFSALNSPSNPCSFSFRTSQLSFSFPHSTRIAQSRIFQIKSSGQEINIDSTTDNESQDSAKSNLFESNSKSNFCSPGPGFVTFDKKSKLEIFKIENEPFNSTSESSKFKKFWIFLPLGTAVVNFFSAAIVPPLLMQTFGDTWLMQFINAFFLDSIFFICLLLILKAFPRIFPELSPPPPNSTPFKSQPLKFPNLVPAFFSRSKKSEAPPDPSEPKNPAVPSEKPVSPTNSNHESSSQISTESSKLNDSNYAFSDRGNYVQNNDLNSILELHLPGFYFFQNSVRVLIICLPVTAMVLLSPMIIALKTSTLILSPFLALYVAQFVILQLPSFLSSFTYPVIPLIFQAYQLYQLNRGWYLTSEIIDVLRSLEATDDILANIGVLGSLRFFLILIGLICICNLAVQLFILPVIYSRLSKSNHRPDLNLT